MNFLIQDASVQGWEYGMLRCLENEIIKQTGAHRLTIGDSPLFQRIGRRFGQGTRYGGLRRFLPRRPLTVPASAKVVWHVLMGPENYSLDLFKNWPANAKHIVYFFDTLPSQMKLMRRLFSGQEWDVLVTSFDDAIPLLEKETGRHWRHGDQAVSLEYFPVVPASERVIHFSSYGRRHPKVHEAVLNFCQAKGLYYDFTTHDRSNPTAEPLTLFRQFAWHLSHSIFTFCWPVEITNPGRAGNLSPITCRWFEAAAAGTSVLGQPPKNPRFRQFFGNEFVTTIDPEKSLKTIQNKLGQIWEQREKLSAQAATLRLKLGQELDWSMRVKRMRELI